MENTSRINLKDYKTLNEINKFIDEQTSVELQVLGKYRKYEILRSMGLIKGVPAIPLDEEYSEPTTTTTTPSRRSMRRLKPPYMSKAQYRVQKLELRKLAKQFIKN
jgi:hypothetical protein